MFTLRERRPSETGRQRGAETSAFLGRGRRGRNRAAGGPGGCAGLPQRPRWSRPSRRCAPTIPCMASKLAALLRRAGVVVSTSTIGRILRKLVAKGAVIPVPTPRRRPGGRRIRFTAAQRYARRLPKGLKPTRPGELVQVDTLFVNVRLTRPSSTSQHTTLSPSGPSDGSLHRHRHPPPKPCSTSFAPKHRSRSPVSKSMVARSSKPSSNKPVPPENLPCS